MNQEKRNKWLAITLAIMVVAATTWILLPEGGGDQIDKTVFRTESLQQVDRVTLTSPRDTTELSFDGGRWLVNKNYPADAGRIKVLFATLLQAEPKRVLPSSMRDSVSKILATSGVTVRLFHQSELVKEFTAGGNAAKSQAWFRDDDTGQMYVMHIPGYRVYVSGIFEVGDPGFRDRLVFALNWMNFRELKTVFPSSAANSFTVSRATNMFIVDGLAKTDTAKLNSWLDQISFLTAVDFLPRNVADSLKDETPVVEIIVNDVASRSYSLRLFRPDAAGNVAGLINGVDAAVFDPEEISALAVPRSFFAGQ